MQSNIQNQPEPAPETKKTNKLFLMILTGIILVAGGAGAAWRYFNPIEKEPESTACTQEAKQCPDGSYVGRTGPNCEFTACPKDADSTADWQTYQNEEYGYEFKYPKTWAAATNAYNQSNSLFGPSASPESGLGGVEVMSYSDSLEEYYTWIQSASEIQYSSKESVNVAGTVGIQADYQRGRSVLLKNKDNIVNIYIGSKNITELSLFDKTISTFKFTK